MLHCNKPNYVVTGAAKHCIKPTHKRTLTAQNGQVRGDITARAEQRPEAMLPAFSCEMRALELQPAEADHGVEHRPYDGGERCWPTASSSSAWAEAARRFPDRAPIPVPPADRQNKDDEPDHHIGAEQHDIMQALRDGHLDLRHHDPRQRFLAREERSAKRAKWFSEPFRASERPSASDGRRTWTFISPSP